MTCREKMMIEHPEDVSNEWIGGVAGCPDDVGYLPTPDYCGGCKDCEKAHICVKCWDREIPEEVEPKPVPHIKDSGNRREFGTGAVRDIHDGKGRCDLMPLDVIGAMLADPVLVYIEKFRTTSDIIDLYSALSSSNLFDNNYTMSLELAKHFEEGCKKYGDNNWRKGIPVHCYIDSAVRHYLKHLRGDRDEPHDRAFCWNIICAIWTANYKPELNDYVLEGGM